MKFMKFVKFVEFVKFVKFVKSVSIGPPLFIRPCYEDARAGILRIAIGVSIHVK